jgi:hypothetical protein
MQRKSKPPRGQTRGHPRSRGASPSPMVAELARRFALFREQHPRGTRVPAELRAAVLSALARGAASGEVERACGVSWGQVRAWEARDGRGPVRTPVDGPEVRVFSVVDEAPAGHALPVASTTEHGLELRVGPWSVSVRLAERG